LTPIKKGNFMVIFLIALLAFGLSTVAASFTNGDLILGMLNITKNNESNELIAVADGDFTALTANQLIIQVNNSTNSTNITNKTNNTNKTNITNIKNVTNFSLD
jgi:mannitol-specific phosphotransferase system IIBC component